MRRYTLVFTLTLSALGCRTVEKLTTTAPVPDSWTRIESAHFALTTDAFTYEGRLVLQRLERFYTVVHALGFIQKPLERDRLEFMATRDDRVLPLRFRPPHPLVYRGYDWLKFANPTLRRPLSRVGWDATQDRPVLVVEAGLLNSTERCMRREIVRQFVMHQMPQAPAWLREGLAEFWGDLRIREGEAAFGRAAGIDVSGRYGEMRTPLQPWASWYIQPVYDVPYRDFYDVDFDLELVEPSWLDCETGYRNFGPRPGFAESGQPDPSVVDVLMGAPNRQAFLKYLRALTEGATEPAARAALVSAVGEELFSPYAWGPFAIQRVPLKEELTEQPVALREIELSKAEASELEGTMLRALGDTPKAQSEAVALFDRARLERTRDEAKSRAAGAVAEAQSGGRRADEGPSACPSVDPLDERPAWTVFRAKASPWALVSCARVLASGGRRDDARALLQTALTVDPSSVPAHRASAQLAIEDGRKSCAEREFEALRTLTASWVDRRGKQAPEPAKEVPERVADCP